MIPTLPFIVYYPFNCDYSTDPSDLNWNHDELIAYHNTEGKGIRWLDYNASIVYDYTRSILIKDSKIRYWLVYHKPYTNTIECISLYSESISLILKTLKVAPNYCTHLRLYVTEKSIHFLNKLTKRYKFYNLKDEPLCEITLDDHIVILKFQ